MRKRIRRRKSGSAAVLIVILALAAGGIAAYALFFGGGGDASSSSVSTGGHPAEPPFSSGTGIEPQSQSETPAETPAETEPEPESESPESASSKPPVSEPQESWELLLVNFETPLPDFFDITLTKVQNTYRMDERAAPHMEEMLAAAEDDGIALLICSGYRSVDKQKELFAAKVQEYMAAGLSEKDARTRTATIIAVPGTSEHHTGLAADIVTPAYQNLDEGFADTDAFRWLDQHAHEYGFILRFPKGKQSITGVIYEPWHYRYVGAEHAKKIKDAGLTLEEYLKK